jgi:hypothetical protein
VPAERRARWSTTRRLEAALGLLADPALDTLVTSEAPFDDLPGLMPSLTGAASRALCHRVRYPAASPAPV